MWNHFIFGVCYKKSNPNMNTWIKLEICWKLLKCMKNFTHIALCKMYLNIRFWHTIPSFMQDLHTISCCVNFWRLKMRHFSPTQEIEPIISHRVFKFMVLGFSAIILTGFLNLRLYGFKERAHRSFLNNMASFGGILLTLCVST